MDSEAGQDGMEHSFQSDAVARMLELSTSVGIAMYQADLPSPVLTGIGREILTKRALMSRSAGSAACVSLPDLSR